jgi:TatD DNase family protein
MIDTHCHIQFNGFKDDREEVIKRCEEKNVILNVVGTQKDTSYAAVEIAEKYPFMYASIGLHPIHLFSTHIDEEESKFLSREENFDYEYYKSLGKSPKVVAVGECGLDLYRIPEGKSKEEILVKQRETFTAQYNLAQELGLAMVIHVREAHEEMTDLLSSLTNQIRGTVHCYTGNWHYAQKYLALGLNIGFTGVITFPPKKSDPQAQLSLLEVVRNCPLDRVVVETDAPYLAPNPYRGKRCEPWMVEEVIKKIAEVKGLSPKEVLVATTQNAKNLFQKIG